MGFLGTKAFSVSPIYYFVVVVVVQSFSPVQLFVTPQTAAHQDFLSFTISWSLLKFRSIVSMVSSNHQTISSSVFPFFSCHQSFPASGSFLMSQLFTSRGQMTWNMLHIRCCRLSDVKLKLQYSGHPIRRASSLEKTPMLGKVEGGRRRE